MFDPDQFLNTSVTEANSTETIPVPVGDWQAQATKVEVNQWQNKDDPSVSGLRLDVTWSIEDQSVKDIVGRDTVTVRQGIMLDLTDTGQLDFSKGKNVNLGRLRAAIGLNEPGQPFAMSMIQGQMAKVRVKHEIYKGAPAAQVDGVSKI
jgi:hypothetical protein